ncbi:hypothetical protein BDV29DRAFT_155059 [Aspergillus leporis]|uniref:Uncharacterized protein n=1 Tax=Aspergillus leporis TaxID=41062 RepID=A0A5N5X5V3_9EURO|nr:hypothetical protein BDV29DRAFT_155059 [Aspergillus leporis]
MAKSKSAKRKHRAQCHWVLLERIAKGMELLDVLNTILRNAVNSTYRLPVYLGPPPLNSTTSSLRIHLGQINPGRGAEVFFCPPYYQMNPGPLRKPLNHHPAILYTTALNTVSLAPVSPSIIPPTSRGTRPRPRHDVLSAVEYKAIIAAGGTAQCAPPQRQRHEHSRAQLLLCCRHHVP